MIRSFGRFRITEVLPAYGAGSGVVEEVVHLVWAFLQVVEFARVVKDWIAAVGAKTAYIGLGSDLLHLPARIRRSPPPGDRMVRVCRCRCPSRIQHEHPSCHQAKAASRLNLPSARSSNAPA